MDQRAMVIRVGASVLSGFFFLFVIIWLPLLSMVTPAKASASVYATGTADIQQTPTVDITVTALAKQKLSQEVTQLELQNDRSLGEWLWANFSALFSVFVVVGSAGFGFWQWTRDRKVDREKRSEERFHSAVAGLEGERMEAKIGGAIVLRTFLSSGYEQFYRQVFDLVVAHLRLQRHPVSSSSEPSTGVRRAFVGIFTRVGLQPREHAELAMLPLNQALVAVFKESFLCVRDRLKQRPEAIDAKGICLDKADLSGADLREAWMPEASLVEANLDSADLTKANLTRADLTGASLNGATLVNTTLVKAHLARATLQWAQLPDAILDGADFTRANLAHANLRNAVLVEGALLIEADLSGADLTRADLSKANLRGAILTDADLTDAVLTGAVLSGANPQSAQSLQGTQMQGVIGLEQRDKCKEMRAIVDG